MRKTIKFANFCGAALMIASLGTAFVTNGSSHVVKADADSMAKAPGGTSTSGIKMSGDYVFAPKVMPGITKTWAFGSNAKWVITDKGNYVLDYTDPGSIASKGKMGVYYQNVGQYDGHTVDVRLTITDYKYDNYKELDAIDNGQRNTMQVYGDRVGVDSPASDVGTSFKYRVDYLDSKTKQPLKLRGQYSFNDIDMNQGIYLDPTTTSHITNTYYTGDTKLSYKKVGDQMLVYNRHFQAYKDDDSATPEDPEHPSYTPEYVNHDETWLPHNFTITYDNAASLTFVWGWPYGGTGSKAGNESKFPGRDFTINGIDKAYWLNPAYSAVLSDEVKATNPENDKKNITTQVIDHGAGAFLELNAQAVLPEKPQAPKKYVSDSDEGTNVVSEIGLEKSVDHNMLKNRYEKYHYQITQNVPDVQSVFHYSNYEISDKIDKVLDASNVHVYNRENQDVTYRFTVVKDDNNELHVVAKPSTLQQGDFYNETYKVTYDAAIKPGVSLADHQDPKHSDQAVIKNTPEVTIDHDTVKGNTTTTNVQFTHPDPQKSVSNDGNGNGTSLNVDFGKEYKYRVDATAPDNEDIKSFSIEDKLEDVLDLKDVKVYDYDDKDSAGNPRDITKEGKLSTDKNDITWTATTPSKWHGKHVKMIIGATVKNNADLVKYLNKDTNKVEIPNQATVKINDKPKTTNTVKVTPNTPDAFVSKKIEVTDDNTGQQIDSSDLNKQENKEDQPAKKTSSSTEKKSILTNMINLFGLFNLKK